VRWFVFSIYAAAGLSAVFSRVKNSWQYANGVTAGGNLLKILQGIAFFDPEEANYLDFIQR